MESFERRFHFQSRTFLFLERSEKTEESEMEKSLSSDDAFTLCYGKFRTNARQIKELMGQIEKRAEKNEE